MSTGALQPAWLRELPGGWALPRLPAVVVDGGDVVVRRGDAMTRFDRDGEQRWHIELGDDTGGGELLLVAPGGAFVTSVAQDLGDPDLLLTVGVDGTPMLRTPIGGRIRTRAALARLDVIDVLVAEPSGGTTCEVVDVATGEVRHRIALPHGGDVLRAYGEGALVASRSATRAGLSVLGGDGSHRAVIDEPCWSVDVDAATVLLTTAPSASVVGRVRVLDAVGLSERWSRPCRPEAAGLAHDTVAFADPDDPTVVLALDTATGESRWRSEPLRAPVMAVTGADGLAWCGHLSGVTALAADDGRELFRLDGMWSLPTVAAGRLYAVGEEALVAFDLP